MASKRDMTVHEWLAAKRAVEERRALLALCLEKEMGTPPPRDEPCPIRPMTVAEQAQRPRALLDDE